MELHSAGIVEKRWKVWSTVMKIEQKPTGVWGGFKKCRFKISDSGWGQLADHRAVGNMVHKNPRVLVDQFATTLRTIRFTTFRKAFVNFWGRSKGLGPQTSFKNCFRL